MLSINVCPAFAGKRKELYNLSQAPSSQSLGVFTSVVVIVSLGSLIVTVQAKVGVLITNCTVTLISNVWGLC